MYGIYRMILIDDNNLVNQFSATYVNQRRAKLLKISKSYILYTYKYMYRVIIVNILYNVFLCIY